MGKNTIITIVIVLVIVIGGYLLFSQSSSQVTAPNSESGTMMPASPDASQGGEENEVMHEEDTMMEDDSMTEGESMMEDESMMPASPDASQGGLKDSTMMEAGAVKEFNVTGKNFEFSVKEIRVKQGDAVRINFSSTDGFHDWTIDEFGAHTKQLQTGESDSVEFVADRTGTFEYYCSVGRHREFGMVGMLIVE